jgi:hypothetical protein
MAWGIASSFSLLVGDGTRFECAVDRWCIDVGFRLGT